VNLEDTEHFLASSNVFSLAEELGWWKAGTPFVWHDVYGGPGNRSNSLREWRALSLAAPSLDLKFADDPAVDRYPFSVKPDRPVTVPKLMEVMRDSYAGTEFDVTARAGFRVDAGPSPLACPWGPPELLELAGVEPERAICTPTSGYVLVAQLREALPDPIGNLLWFAYGPADTSCFVPIYAGVRDLPGSWDHPANFTRIDREQAQWNFRLVQNLAQRVGYQQAIRDVRRMIEPAEQRYLAVQAELERTAVGLFREQGAGAAEVFLTDYSRAGAVGVGSAYSELVDYLMLKYLVGDPEFAPPHLPRIFDPMILERAK
jgi:dipeptidase